MNYMLGLFASLTGLVLSGAIVLAVVGAVIRGTLPLEESVFMVIFTVVAGICFYAGSRLTIVADTL